MEIQPGVFALSPADYPRTLEVWETSVRATHDFVAEDDIHVFRPMVAAALPAIENLACVRDRAGQPAGFVAVVNGKVEMLFLDPRCRGQGAGRRLLEYAVNVFGAVELDVNEQNPQAIGFYQHLGFEVVGRSELDSTGKPYPLLQMRLRRGAAS